ncbi:MAG: 50S ribosomal protein L32 [Trichlorobacter sp.]|jgi:large subunit ribosomal protein L32|nr:50S ribosomal protein L32 [Trichlorobacter sp.]
MAVPKKKTSKSRKNMRRAHDFMTAPNLSVCPECSAPKMSHRVCPSCGMYKGRQVIDAA